MLDQSGTAVQLLSQQNRHAQQEKEHCKVVCYVIMQNHTTLLQTPNKTTHTTLDE